MSILIKGIEMPTSCFDNVMLCNDGRVTVNAIGFFAPLAIAVYIMLLLNCFRLGSILDELKKIRRRLDDEP